MLKQNKTFSRSAIKQENNVDPSRKSILQLKEVTQKEDILQRNISRNIPELKEIIFHIERTKQVFNTLNAKTYTPIGLIGGSLHKLYKCLTTTLYT